MLHKTVSIAVVLGMFAPFAAIAQNQTGMGSESATPSSQTSTPKTKMSTKVKQKAHVVKEKMKNPKPYKSPISSSDPTKGN